MSLEIPPFIFLVLGAFLLPLFPKKVQPAAFLVFPLLGLITVWTLPDQWTFSTQFYSYELVICKVDALSRVFGIIFALIGLIAGIYSWHVKDTPQQSSALLYGAGALGVTFAGDFFTLLLFWELMAIASTFLIWARRDRESASAGMRYFLVHLFGGSLLMAGIALHFSQTGQTEIRAFAPGESVAAWLMLIGVAINTAIPPLHAWLSDSYPKATVTGAIFLSAMTTKSAVYVLARVFPAWEILLYLGVTMALYGVVYAVLANDIRQILAYHIISQVGYMVAGVGIGTEMAINGTAAHAFSHILYKALLFMGAGVVLHTTGRSKLSELGGLGKCMPLAVWLYMIGAFSISGFPLFNGFISKSIIISSAGVEHLYVAKFLLILASVGTFLHTGLKLPYHTWFGRDSGVKPTKKIPRNMLVAMGALAFFCTFFGVFPQVLYSCLPFPIDYQPYTKLHLIETTQLLALTFVAFWILRWKVAGEPLIALDTDWFYRKPAPLIRKIFIGGVNRVFHVCDVLISTSVRLVAQLASNPIELWQKRRFPQRPFDADEDRFPLSVSLGLTILIIVLITLISVTK